MLQAEQQPFFSCSILVIICALLTFGGRTRGQFTLYIWSSNGHSWPGHVPVISVSGKGNSTRDVLQDERYQYENRKQN